MKPVSRTARDGARPLSPPVEPGRGPGRGLDLPLGGRGACLAPRDPVHLFTNPTVICDLRTPAFNRRYSGRIGRLRKDLGAPYGRLEGDEEVDLIQAAGFRLTLRLSVVGRAAELGSLRIPRWLLSTLFRTLRDGYAIGAFEAAPVG
jgi:hypothetical protein